MKKTKNMVTKGVVRFLNTIPGCNLKLFPIHLNHGNPFAYHLELLKSCNTSVFKNNETVNYFVLRILGFEAGVAAK